MYFTYIHVFIEYQIGKKVTNKSLIASSENYAVKCVPCKFQRIFSTIEPVYHL